MLTVELSARPMANGPDLTGDKDVARQKDAIKKGVRFVTTHTDLGFLISAASQKVGELR